MGCSRGFLGAQTNAELRTGSKIARHGNRNVAERMEEFMRAGSFAGAIGTLAKVLLEPGLVGLGEPFDQRLRKELLRADVKVFIHTAPSGNADFKAASPR